MVPESSCSEVLEGVHDHAGHQGQFWCLGLVRQCFFWLNLDRDVSEHVSQCQHCIVSNAAEPEDRAPLESIKSSRHENSCVLTSAEASNNKSIDVLVVTDHFTRLKQAFPCETSPPSRSQEYSWTNIYAVLVILKGFIVTREQILRASWLVNCSEFLGWGSHTSSPTTSWGMVVWNVWRELCEIWFALYTPKCREHGLSICIHLRFLYNCTTHEMTSFAPLFPKPLFGKVLHLPEDIVFCSVFHDPAVINCDT